MYFHLNRNYLESDLALKRKLPHWLQYLARPVLGDDILPVSWLTPLALGQPRLARFRGMFNDQIEDEIGTLTISILIGGM